MWWTAAGLDDCCVLQELWLSALRALPSADAVRPTAAKVMEEEVVEEEETEEDCRRDISGRKARASACGSDVITSSGMLIHEL